MKHEPLRLINASALIWSTGAPLIFATILPQWFTDLQPPFYGLSRFFTLETDGNGVEVFGSKPLQVLPFDEHEVHRQVSMAVLIRVSIDSERFLRLPESSMFDCCIWQCRMEMMLHISGLAVLVLIHKLDVANVLV